VDTVSITIPASPVYLQVVRLTAASLASRLGFSLDDIEDLKIAVDELSAYLTGAQGRDGVLDITFTITGDRIDIEGRGRFAPGEKVRSELTDFSRQILATVVDSASLESTNGTPFFQLTKTKRA
jgi:serine/threonine-protein kinase RsbW